LAAAGEVVVVEAVSKYLRLPARQRAILLHTVFTLWVARLATWMLPFATSRRWLVGSRRATTPTLTPDQVSWAMRHAQRVVPRATCLPQALAAEALLTRGGLPADLRIGVKKDASGKLLAHAWVESEGRVVVGDLPGGVDTYTRLPTLPRVWPETRPADLS
jgi:transglutaminase superfamily protein